MTANNDEQERALNRLAMQEAIAKGIREGRFISVYDPNVRGMVLIRVKDGKPAADAPSN